MREIKTRRAPKRLLPKDMRELALTHLDRFASTKRRLIEVMRRRARASAGAHGDDPGALLDAIEETIHWLEAKGVLSDRAYAEAKARALIGRGASRQRIAANLWAKGIDPDIARAAITRLTEEFGDPDLAAAKSYAKRRRLGCYRKAGKKELDSKKFGTGDRDLAAMARAGFSLAVARRALKGGE